MKATSQADSTRTATAKVTVSSTPWRLTYTITRAGTWWVEVIPHDATVASMSVKWTDGSTLPLALNYIQYGANYPDFDANYGFPLAGGKYVFTARSKDNRTTSATLTVPACNNPDASGVCQ